MFWTAIEKDLDYLTKEYGFKVHKESTQCSGDASIILTSKELCIRLVLDHEDIITLYIAPGTWHTKKPLEEKTKWYYFVELVALVEGWEPDNGVSWYEKVFKVDESSIAAGNGYIPNTIVLANKLREYLPRLIELFSPKNIAKTEKLLLNQVTKHTEYDKNHRDAH